MRKSKTFFSEAELLAVQSIFALCIKRRTISKDLVRNALLQKSEEAETLDRFTKQIFMIQWEIFSGRNK